MPSLFEQSPLVENLRAGEKAAQTQQVEEETSNECGVEEGNKSERPRLRRGPVKGGR